MLQNAKQLLKKIYGYDSFRKGQENIIEGILNGKDTLAILPTGGGKSICYQLPAMLLPGTTLVISPLISLMKDQVDSLTRLGVPAAFLNSSLSPAEYREVLQGARNGDYKLLYAAPERLDAPMFQALSESMKIPLIAIDEAHCVSQWGHDFRPSYRQLAGWINRLEQRPLVAAFTATATSDVADDIEHVLGLRSPSRFVTGFARPNLSLSVITGVDKKRFLTQFLSDRKDQSGIIYTATRKEAEDVCSQLQKAGFEAGKYHGGLSDTERAETQEQFRFDDIRIMVATNAFGMGIDKPNVRYVLHWQMPGDLESYYQEAGRAGRDGEESQCVLLFEPADMQVQRFLIEQGAGDEGRKSIQMSKLHMMMNYSRTQRCLQQFIVDYFGESDVGPCGKCSCCQDKSEPVDRTEDAKMALSCVGRMKGRFGVTMAAKVLKGSRDKRLLEFGLDRLTTYGLMRHLPEKEIADWLYWLVAEGYLRLSEGQYPVVSLTTNALPVLEGKQEIMQRVRASVRKSGESASGSSPIFEALKAWRKETAAREGVPPFMVFFDSTLKEIAMVRPASMDELLGVKGIGSAKAQKYWNGIAPILAEFGGVQGTAGHEGATGRRTAPGGQAATERETSVQLESNGHKSASGFVGHQGASGFVAPKGGGTADPGFAETDLLGGVTGRGTGGDSAAGDETPSHVASLELFQDGHAPSEIAKLRGLSAVTVEGHIIRCAEEGLEVDWDRIIPAGLEPLIADAVRNEESGKLKPVKEALPAEVTYFAIRGVMAKMGLKG
ncbi:DNA helicase RecQ [Paenibacillus sp. CAU 1782]